MESKVFISKQIKDNISGMSIKDNRSSGLLYQIIVFANILRAKLNAGR